MVAKTKTKKKGCANKGKKTVKKTNKKVCSSKKTGCKSKPKTRRRKSIIEKAGNNLFAGIKKVTKF